MNDTVDTPRRRFAPLLLAAAALLAGHAHADDATLGKTIATQGTTTGVAACIGCHGSQGEGNAAAGFPRLAGTNAAYLSAQLAAFADGSRQNPVMQPLSKLLTPHERDAVSAYFASLPACAQCHGPGGLGVGTAFPPLAGQPVAYIAGQLNGWKHGTRPPGPMALMPAIAGKLSDADIDAVAAYYARGGAAQGDKR